MRYILLYDFLSELRGLEKLMAQHARYLQEEGHEVLLLFGAIKPEMLQHKEFEGLNIQAYGKNVFASVFFGERSLRKIINPQDILISYSFPVNFTIRNLPNRKIQYLNHFPNFLYLSINERFTWANNGMRKVAVAVSLVAGPIIRWLDKKLVKKNAVIFFNSEFTKKRLKDIYKREGIVSYPPVSKDFKPIMDLEVLEKYEIKHKFILASGRVIPDKRVDWLISAISLLKEKNIELVICGHVDDSYKAELMKNATLDTEHKIKFLGIVPKEDLIKLYSMADVYAFPTPKEDFGLALVEALSCGTPVVTWNDGSGPTEQVIEGVNGFLAEPYNLKDFAKKIDKCLNTIFEKKEILDSAKKFSSLEVKKSFMEAL